MARRLGILLLLSVLNLLSLVLFGCLDQGSSGTVSAAAATRVTAARAAAADLPGSTTTGPWAPRQLGGAVWRFQTRGPVRSTPAVGGGLVVVGSDDGSLYALDALEGNERWRVTTGGAVASSPAIADGAVFFASRDRSIRAVRLLTGEEIWRFDTGPDLPQEVDRGRELFLSSPTIVAGKLLAGAGDGRLYCLDAASGRLLWSLEAGGRVRSSPAVAGGTVVFGSSAGRLTAAGLETGAVQWHYDLEAAIESSPEIAGDSVLFAGGDGRQYALEARRGRLLWSYDHAPAPIVASPAVARGRSYLGSGEAWTFDAVDLRSGRRAWRFHSAGGAASSALAAGDLVLFGTEKGSLLALDAETGREVWRFQTSDAILAAPAVAAGRVFFGNDAGEVYALAGSGARHHGSWIPWRAVYWDPTLRGMYEGADVLAEVLEGRGYLRLDAGALPAFLAARLADGIPSVVVFAGLVAPEAILAEDDTRVALVRRFLDAGGRIVWPGLVPFGYFTDPGDDRPALDLAAAERALGVRQRLAPSEELRATATAEGERWGLPAWWLGVMPAEACDVTSVLGEDAEGRALAWVKEYAHGGRFVRFGGQGLPLDDLALVWRVAERDLFDAGRPDPFDLRWIAKGRVDRARARPPALYQ